MKLRSLDSLPSKLYYRAWHSYLRWLAPRPPTGDSVHSDLPLFVVIPAAPKDADVLSAAVDSVRRNVRHPVSDVFVVGPREGQLEGTSHSGAFQFVDERSVLPITKEQIPYQVANLDRSGWLFQQLLKLGADVLSDEGHYLVVDADTVFVQPQVFEIAGRQLLNCSDEFHRPYFYAYQRLIGEPISLPVSFVAHHILIDVAKLRDLRQRIEARWKVPWYEAIIQATDRKAISGHADYETYGHFVRAHYPDAVQLVYWSNRSVPRRELAPVTELEHRYGGRYRTVSFHSYAKT